MGELTFSLGSVPPCEVSSSSLPLLSSLYVSVLGQVVLLYQFPVLFYHKYASMYSVHVHRCSVYTVSERERERETEKEGSMFCGTYIYSSEHVQ